jgi:circadian clock protein KaiC
VIRARLQIARMPAHDAVDPASGRAPTGIAGLDDILGGGLPADRLYLVQGTPGVGKTTMALQFLLEGAQRGESTLYITLSETEVEIRQVAASHGWSLDAVHLFELSSAEQTLRLDDENTLYATADVDLKETMRVLLEEVARVKPARVVFDSLSEIRLLSQTPMRYRRQLLALKQHFAGKNCTVLLLDDCSGGAGDVQVESLAHGVIALEQSAVDYGGDRRRLRVAKLRGIRFRSGYHDFVIEPGGLQVFPRLVAAEHRSEFRPELLPSGVAALDALLGGGLGRATSTLIMGPAGTGKSAIAAQFAAAAAERGEVSALFLFEERRGTLIARSQALGLELDEQVAAGRIHLTQIDPAELAPDQFTHLVRDAVERHGARLIVIDSINGYFNAMPHGRFLTLQMHELLSYLAERGVASILTMAQSGMMGAMSSPVDVSYLSDTVIVLRFFEASGRVRKAISVIKKRSGRHEDSIRELTMGDGGLRVGEPLSTFRSVLTGVPHLAASDTSTREAG